MGVLTVSDGVFHGGRQDESGQEAVRWVEERLQGQVAARETVPDEAAEIQRVLRRWSDTEGLDLVLTTGGTGLAPRDVTPEATLGVLEREAPGLAEAIRQESRRITPHAMLSRGVAGTRGRTLILNLPGSPKAVSQSLAVVEAALPHGLELLREVATRHQT